MAHGPTCRHWLRTSLFIDVSIHWGGIPHSQTDPHIICKHMILGYITAIPTNLLYSRHSRPMVISIVIK